MFTLQRLNVVRIVDTETKRDGLLSKGFSLVEETERLQQEENPIDKMTVNELKAYAAEKGIDISDITKKDDIKERIKAAGQEQK